MKNHAHLNERIGHKCGKKALCEMPWREESDWAQGVRQKSRMTKVADVCDKEGDGCTQKREGSLQQSEFSGENNESSIGHIEFESLVGQ